MEPGKRSVKTCVRGLRIRVYSILSYLAAGMNTKKMIYDFPDSKETDVVACVTCSAEKEHQQLQEVCVGNNC